MMSDDIGQMPGDLPTSDFNQEKINQNEKELDTLIAKTFSTAAGQKTLKWLRDSTIEKPCMAISDGIGGVLMGYAREGENGLVRKIEMRMKRGQKGD